MSKCQIKYITVPSTSLQSELISNISIETECLYGESVRVFEKKQNKSFVTLLTDNYSGWVNSKNLGNLSKGTHRVLSLRTFIYKHPDIKSSHIYYLPLGSMVNVSETNKEWIKVILKDKETGYILAKDIINKDKKVLDWVKTAEKMIGVPYKWGGRDTIGIDCSALIQLSLQSAGYNVPRNTKEQCKALIFHKKSLVDINRGDLIFWTGHVGVMVDKINILHANAFHMKTLIEPLVNVLKRDPNYTSICSI